MPPTPAERAPPEAEGIRFVLNDILFDGMTAYSKQDLVSLFRSHLGQEVSLASIYTIARALTSRYRNDGYLLAQVIVPQQRVREGVVRLRAIEGYVDQVEFRGDAIDRPGLVNAYAAKIKAVAAVAGGRARALSPIAERLGVMVSDALGHSEDPGEVDRFIFRLAFWLSIGFLIALGLPIFIAPFSELPAPELLKSSLLWMVPLQALVSAALGAFFVNRK